MVQPSSTEPGLESAADAAGEPAIEALSLLANETRLSVLLALWEASEPFEPNTAVAFSELRDRVGIRRGGQFHYHLDKLVGRYVTKRDDGYALSRFGTQIVRTVIAGAGLEAHSLEPIETDRECPECGAGVSVTYDDGWMLFVCDSCDGLAGQRTDMPDGALGGQEVNPAALTDGRLVEYATANTPTPYGPFTIGPLQGVCDVCDGPMTSWLSVCEDHPTDEGGTPTRELCSSCNQVQAVAALFACSVCKKSHSVPPKFVTDTHSAVTAFYWDHGVAIQNEYGAPKPGHTGSDLDDEVDQTIASREPAKVRITYRLEGDELQLTIDEDLDVVEVVE
jgi:hypothetical protein